MFHAIKNFLKKLKSFFWKTEQIATPAVASESAPIESTAQQPEIIKPDEILESAAPEIAAQSVENTEILEPALPDSTEPLTVDFVESAPESPAENQASTEPAIESDFEKDEAAESEPARAQAPARVKQSTAKKDSKNGAMSKAQKKAQRLILKGALPKFKENKGVRPNENARSSLFVAKRNDQLKFVDNRICVKTQDAEVSASGWEVSVYDEHTFNSLIYMATQETDKKFFDDFSWSSRKILKAAHRPTAGKKTYDDLEKSINRLASVTVFVKTLKKNYFGHLLEAGTKDNADQTWKIRFPKELLNLYAANCSQFNLDSQNRLLKNPIAAKIFSFYISLPNGKHSHKLQHLQAICGLTDSCELKEFKRRLIKALPMVSKEFEICGGNFEYENAQNKECGFFKGDEKDESGRTIEFLKIIKVNRFKEIANTPTEQQALPYSAPEKTAQGETAKSLEK